MIGQTFSLYNVAGLIDKRNNIYYVPHTSLLWSNRITSKPYVCVAYKKLFDTVCPPSSKFRDIEVTQWSPEDRKLTVKGTVDLFRKSRSSGKALNYVIVTRTVSSESGSERTYYYSFFIDSVRQAGLNSVDLNLTPDYFTDFFYLNNTNTISQNYDPFNSIMKNCFVDRQHYDRFSKDSNNRLHYINLEKILNTSESFNYKVQLKDEYYHYDLGTISMDKIKSINEELKRIGSQSGFNNYIDYLVGIEDDTSLNYIVSLFTSYINILFKENILFTLSYTTDLPSSLYRHNHGIKAGGSKVGNFNSPLLHCVMPFISIPFEFSNIKKEWFIQKLTLKYNNYYSDKYIINGDDIMTTVKDLGLTPYILSAYISKYSPLHQNLYGVVISDGLVEFNYMIDIEQKNEFTLIDSRPLYADFPNGVLSENSIGILPSYEFVDGKKVLISGVRFTGHFTTVDGVQSALGDAMFQVNSLSGKILPNQYESSRIKFLTATDNYGENKIKEGNIDSYNFMNNFVFIIGNFNLSTNTIRIPDKLENVNLRTQFIDPILNSDPYSFYSISIYETEQILSMFKYYRDYNNGYFTFKLTPILSYNDSYKVGLIPSFLFNGDYKRYYSEALVITISSQLPLVEDSWLEYYVLNKAQMKNQYAVQQNNYQSGLRQSLISGLTGQATGTVGGATHGSTGALLGATGGTIKAVGNLANTVVANTYAVENINLSQKAKMADMGAKPDTVRLAGSDVLYDLIQNDMGLHFNHYTIDNASYNSISKYLERFGYKIELFDSLHVFDRIGLNYIKLVSFDFVEDSSNTISTEQADAIQTIFEQGVTLLHDKEYLHNIGDVGYHNIEMNLL